MANVILHIYDVTTAPIIEKINKGLTAVGTGAFHGGVEVYDQEWSYGYTPTGSGVFPGAPKQCTMHHYRESVPLGTTNMSKDEVAKVVEQMSTEWAGVDYDLLRKNCVLFSKAFSDKIGVGGNFPDWVVNLAGAGATLQDGFMTTATQAQAMAIIAKAKAKEIDKQYEIKGQAKANFKNMMEASKKFEQENDVSGKAKAGAQQAGQAIQEGGALMYMKATELDGTYKITEQSKAKWSELNEKHKISKKAGKAVQKGQELLGTGVAALQAKLNGGTNTGAAAELEGTTAPKSKNDACCQC